MPVAVFLLSWSMATLTPFPGHAVPPIEPAIETVFSNPDASDIPLQLPVGQRAGHGTYLLDKVTETEPGESQNKSLKVGSGRALDPLRVPKVFFASRIVDFGFELKKTIYPFHFFF